MNFPKLFPTKIHNRLKPEWVRNENLLIQFIFKTMDQAVNEGPYTVVFDMSWARLDSEMKNIIYNQLSKIFKVLNRKYVFSGVFLICFLHILIFLYYFL